MLLSERFRTIPGEYLVSILQTNVFDSTEQKKGNERHAEIYRGHN